MNRNYKRMETGRDLPARRDRAGKSRSRVEKEAADNCAGSGIRRQTKPGEKFLYVWEEKTKRTPLANLGFICTETFR